MTNFRKVDIYEKVIRGKYAGMPDTIIKVAECTWCGQNISGYISKKPHVCPVCGNEIYWGKKK